MDWKNIQADVTKILPCDYTAGREGANITGITIHETGEEGKGARFEIRVGYGEYTEEKS